MAAVADTVREGTVGRSRVRWVFLGFLVSVFFLFGWFDQSVETTSELGSPARLVVEGGAGPIQVTVSADDQARVHRQDSWLFSEPTYEEEETGDALVVRSTCPGLFPCRSALRLEVPIGMVVEVVAENGVVDVVSFEGELTVRSTSDDGVILGPVRGIVSVDSPSGNVTGRHVQLDELTVSAGDGSVDVAFARAPASVSVTAEDEPVRIVLPDLLYRLDIATSSADVEINVDRAAGAPREILISSTGPVIVTPSP